MILDIKQLNTKEGDNFHYVMITTANRVVGNPIPGIQMIQANRVDFHPPPSVPLQTEQPHEIIRILEYASLCYRSTDSAAAEFAVAVFEAGREWALGTEWPMIGFDWDYTLSNAQIAASLFQLATASLARHRHLRWLAGRLPIIGAEAPRPFMHELALGMMVGFAVRQGLKVFDEWERYRPRVGIVTGTWPDRLLELARYFPLIDLMEGRLPGRPHTGGESAWKMHVHFYDFVSYAEKLFAKLEEKRVTATEKVEADAYFGEGRPYQKKPIGAILEKWQVGSVLLFDDSAEVVDFYRQMALLGVGTAIQTHNPYSPPDRNIPELSKVTFGLTHASRMQRAARKLAETESQTHVPFLLERIVKFRKRVFDVPPTCHPSEIESTPEGVVLQIAATGPTPDEFERLYGAPARKLQNMIDAARK